MNPGAGDSGIDPESWQVSILRLPKRFSRGVVHGFCAGNPVGRVENARARTLACWWPGGEPELLVLEGRDEVEAGRATGDVIPGQWRNSVHGSMGAIVWRVHDGRAVGTDMHSPSYERTWALGAGGDLIVGAGSTFRNPDQRSRKVGLVWSGGGQAAEVAGAGDVVLFATDGARLAGSINGRAALWPQPTATPVDLSPAGLSLSEVQALDGEMQIGVAWRGMRARAAVWRGTADTFADLTPRGYESSQAFAGAGGFQVGYVRAKDVTRNGTPGADNSAVVWAGTSDTWFNLNGLLPADRYNSSIAWAIAISGDTIHIGGEARRYEVGHSGTPQESHTVPIADPVIWTARLRRARDT